MADDDDDIKLSEYAADALRIFYEEEAERQKDFVLLTSDEGSLLPEDWELSQFWYDNETAKILAKSAIAAAGSNGRIVCISCPTIFSMLRVLEPDRTGLQLLEFDKRFMVKFPEHFTFYDYKDPLNFPEELKHSFDLVLVDPPFLAEECLEKVTQTVKLLAKDKIVLCSGAVMEDTANELLCVEPCSFIPKHINLANEFKCYSNFNFDEYVNNAKNSLKEENTNLEYKYVI